MTAPLRRHGRGGHCCGQTEHPAARVFPDEDDWVLRGNRLRAGDCLALHGQPGPSRISRVRADEGDARSFESFEDRSLIDFETHRTRAIFTWGLSVISREGLLKGKTVGVDATTLEANAAMRSIERASGHRGELRRIPGQIGFGVRHRNSYTRGPRTIRLEARKTTSNDSMSKYCEEHHIPVGTDNLLNIFQALNLFLRKMNR